MATAGSTYSFVAQQTVTGSVTASVTFTNLPQNYTDLILVINELGDNTATNIAMRVGSSNTYDTNTIYSNTNMGGTGSSTGASGRETNIDHITIDGGYGYMTTSWGQLTVHLMNYTNTNMYKTFITRASNAAVGVGAVSGTWRSFNPINTIYLVKGGNANFAVGSTFAIYGIKAADVPSIVTPTKAIGGDLIVTDGTYTYHAFKSTGSFIPAQALTCDILVVAGGGGGGGSNGWESGGGGGAGGLQLFSSQALTSGTTLTATVGAGGMGTVSTWGTQGSNSQFASLTASVGGGRGNGGGGAGSTPATGLAGGSGGGGEGNSNTGGGNATSGQGNVGGSGQAASDSSGAGGGGGAGTAGSSANSVNGAAGGAGVNTYSSWLSVTGLGASGYIAGGGGGAASYYFGGSGGVGGSGGAGTGANATSGNIATANGSAATPNTGSGGGGSRGNTSTGGTGGSGIIIVRYLS